MASRSFRLDINCDLGELPELIANGTQGAILGYITQANIACGGHAGDEDTMKRTVEQCLLHGVAIGAHPSYPDRENFGRIEMKMPDWELADAITEQLFTLDRIVKAEGGRISHVKPHGALYNTAVRRPEVAASIANGVEAYSPHVLVMALARSPMLQVIDDYGLRTIAEGFADRRYEADGTLRSRAHEDALITDPQAAADQADRMAREGWAETVCIHSDTPGALAIVRAVSERLQTRK